MTKVYFRVYDVDDPTSVDADQQGNDNIGSLTGAAFNEVGDTNGSTK